MDKMTKTHIGKFYLYNLLKLTLCVFVPSFHQDFLCFEVIKESSPRCQLPFFTHRTTNKTINL